MAEFEKEKRATALMDPACLVRRLSQLKSGFHRKLQETERNQQLWSAYKYSQVLYNQVNRFTDETRVKYEQVISSYDDLELSVTEAVWQNEYQARKQEIEDEYLRFNENVGGVAIEFEAACIEQRQREAAAIVAAVAPAQAGGGPGGAGGGAGGGAAAATPG